MYVYTRQVTTQRGIATLLALALVLWAVGANLFTTAEAANLTHVKDTLSNSNLGSPSNHTIEFLSPTGVGGNQTITAIFPVGFTGTSSVVVGDVDLEINGVDEVLVAGAPAAGQWGFAWSNRTLVLTSAANESLPANATATIKIGTNANGGVNRLTNPNATSSYQIDVTAGSGVDTGTAMVAILGDTYVTAAVDATLTFTVSGVASNQTVNGSPTTTAAASTGTTLPFGTLAAGTSKTLGQDLTVATNARNGYVVTVQQSQNLLSSTGADIDGFSNGAYTNTPTAWVAPSNNISQENTWGHWGLTSDDVDLWGAGSNFGSNQWVAASSTPRAIMAHNGPADGVTNDIGSARIGYQVQISALQEAGDDYNTTLTYVATPTF